jgi:2-(1,2-epoxy-1,2-dihydrophenyl)acetyl-CoA isomerase
VSEDQIDELIFILEELEATDDVRAVVLTGSGNVFHVGADLTARESPGRPREVGAYRQQLLRAARVVELLYAMPQLTVAVVNGGCAGAGMAFALAADLRWAAAEAKFNTAFMSVGLPGELGAIWFATNIVGAARAREIFFLPRKLSAEQARDLGLVSHVLPRVELLPAVLEALRPLAQAPALAVASMKGNFVDASAVSLREYLPREAQRMADATVHGSPLKAHPHTG